MRRLIAVLTLALTLSACATAQKLGAASDVHALLVSIRDNDSRTFDAHVDHEALVQPKTFRLVAEQYGYKPDTPIPNAVVIAQALKKLPDGTVCATKGKNGPCMLIFAKEDGVWKLTRFEGDFSMLKIKLGRL